MTRLDASVDIGGRAGRPVEARAALAGARGASLAVLAALAVAPYVPTLGPMHAPLAAGASQATAALLDPIGLPVVREGTLLIHAAGFACEIDAACAGSLPAALMAAAVLMTPASNRRRLIGLLLLPALALLLNVVRIAALMATGVHAPAAFELAHAGIAPALMTGLLMAAWWIWRGSRNAAGTGSWPPFATRWTIVRSAPRTVACAAATLAAPIVVLAAGTTTSLPLLAAEPAMPATASPIPPAPGGDLLVRFSDPTTAHAAVKRRFDDARATEGTTALAARLSTELGVPLVAGAVTSGRELVLSIDRAQLARQVGERLAVTDAFIGPARTNEAGATVPGAPTVAAPADAAAGAGATRVRPAPLLSLRLIAPVGSLAAQLVADARRGNAAARERLATVGRELLPGHPAAVATRLDAHGELTVDIDLAALLVQVLAALQRHPDVAYAQANRMLRPTPR